MARVAFGVGNCGGLHMVRCTPYACQQLGDTAWQVVFSLIWRRKRVDHSDQTQTTIGRPSRSTGLRLAGDFDQPRSGASLLRPSSTNGDGYLATVGDQMQLTVQHIVLRCSTGTRHNNRGGESSANTL